MFRLLLIYIYILLIIEHNERVSPEDLYLTTDDTHKGQAIIPTARFEPADPSKRAAANPHLRPHGHWNRLCMPYGKKNTRTFVHLNVQ